MTTNEISSHFNTTKNISCVTRAEHLFQRFCSFIQRTRYRVVQGHFSLYLKFNNNDSIFGFNEDSGVFVAYFFVKYFQLHSYNLSNVGRIENFFFLNFHFNFRLFFSFYCYIRKMSLLCTRHNCTMFWILDHSYIHLCSMYAGRLVIEKCSKSYKNNCDENLIIPLSFSMYYGLLNWGLISVSFHFNFYDQKNIFTGLLNCWL